MAKTLIGNIKGKDGRGISKIEKTATTGSVDTYTIAYTDDTTSTFDVNNSDSVALQRQIVPSAAVESSATASQAYAEGDYVVVSGVLRKVKSAIARGNTISDSNSTATTVTGELATITPSTIAVGGSATIVGIWRGVKTMTLSGQFNSFLTGADLQSLTGHSLSDGSWSGFCFWPDWGQASYGAPVLGFSPGSINVYISNGARGASATVGFVLVLTE